MQLSGIVAPFLFNRLKKFLYKTLIYSLIGYCMPFAQESHLFWWENKNSIKEAWKRKFSLFIKWIFWCENKVWNQFVEIFISSPWSESWRYNWILYYDSFTISLPFFEESLAFLYCTSPLKILSAWCYSVCEFFTTILNWFKLEVLCLSCNFLFNRCKIELQSSHNKPNLKFFIIFLINKKFKLKREQLVDNFENILTL